MSLDFAMCECGSTDYNPWSNSNIVTHARLLIVNNSEQHT